VDAGRAPQRIGDAHSGLTVGSQPALPDGPDDV
jgi:hypothetical protein